MSLVPRARRIFPVAFLLQAILAALLLLIVTPIASYAAAGESKQTIYVGYTPLQPPFAVKASGAGLVQDLLALMNAKSHRYNFEQKRLYAARVAEVFHEGRYDLVAFQNKRWGYDVPGTAESLVLVKDRGAYFQMPGINQPEGLPIIGATQGFHYAFAGFSTETLLAMPNVLLTVNEQDVLNLVLRGRVHKGVASVSLLQWFLHTNQGMADKYEILEESDYRYDRTLVVLPQSRMPIEAVNSLLLSLKEDSAIEAVFAKYGLPAPPLTPPGAVVLD